MESPRPSRKQPVSVDDMMDRLKSRPTTGGTRVVDVKTVDGETHEIRKKRKRRSHQPKKVHEARIGRMKRLVIFGLLPLIAAMLVGWYLLGLRYKGESFRESLSSRATEVIGLKTSISPLEPDGFSLNSRRILIEGNKGGILKEVEVMDLKSDMGLGAHFSNNWSIRRLTAQNGTIHLQESGSGLSGTLPMPENAQDKARLMVAGLGLNSSPKRFDVRSLRIGECSVVWHPLDEDIDPYTIVSDVVVTSSDMGVHSPVIVTGGMLSLTKWPELEITHGKMDLSSDGLRIQEIRMERESFGDLEGKIKGHGTIGFGGNMASNMSFEFKRLDVRDFLPSYWRAIVIGKISGDIKFQSEIGKPNSLVGEGDFSMPGAVLGNLPSLKRLSVCAGDANLARIVFENGLSGKIRISSAGLELYEVRGKSSDFFGLRGGITFSAKGQISGNMEIGVSEEVLSGAKSGKPSFFGEAEEGLCWGNAVLSGKQDNLRDDLTTRFEVLIEDVVRRERDARLQTTPPNQQGVKVRPDNVPTDSQKENLENVFDKLIGE